MSVLASEAGALFVARASEARGELALDDANAQAVHDLCVRLDGIPLAIELAAAQTKVMTPGEILTRLDKQFRLFTGGRRTSLERHQTLRAAIDWSYDLLTDDERALLDRLSVCVGGFDLDAVVAIAAGTGADEFEAFELLASLVAKSLVERNERDGVTRYRLLEMIRQYAAEQLNATGAAETARDDHARHYLALAIALFGEMSTAADYEALDRLDAETANIAAAGRWLLAGRTHRGAHAVLRRRAVLRLVRGAGDDPRRARRRSPAKSSNEPTPPRCPGYPTRLLDRGQRARVLQRRPSTEFGHLTDLATAVSGGEPTARRHR